MKWLLGLASICLLAGLQGAAHTSGSWTTGRPGKPLSEMNRELERAEAAFAGYRSYAWIAIHDDSAFRRLAEARL